MNGGGLISRDVVNYLGQREYFILLFHCQSLLVPCATGFEMTISEFGMPLFQICHNLHLHNILWPIMCITICLLEFCCSTCYCEIWTQMLGILTWSLKYYYYSYNLYAVLATFIVLMFCFWRPNYGALLGGLDILFKQVWRKMKLQRRSLNRLQQSVHTSHLVKFFTWRHILEFYGIIYLH